MRRTTPPRPVDIEAVFPELSAHARMATRLHPRPGRPGPRDSSIGGPLLWPAGEPWPYCAEPHDEAGTFLRPAGERVRRRVLAAVWSRTRRGERPRLTPAERALLARAGRRVLGGPPARVPLLPVAQLYAGIPGWRGPGGTDVLQVLWCPFRHPHRDHHPAVSLRWRRAQDVRLILAAPPEPELMEGAGYLPEPCLLHPEEVVEYEYIGLLPRGLYERIGEWEDDTGHRYHFDHSIADGWKIGGLASWSLTDPYPVLCDCGAGMRLLLTVAGSEWSGSGTWRPMEEALEEGAGFCRFPGAHTPTLVDIGRGYRLYVFTCEASADHPCRAVAG